MRWVPRAWLAALCACASPGTHTPPAASVEATESTPPADVAALPPAPPISDLNDAKAAIHEGRLDPAIAFLRAWTREHPDELSAQLNLAHALQLSGAIAEAQQTLDAVADRDPVAARRAAELRAGLGDLSGAVAQLEDASTRWPDDLGIVGARVWLAMHTGRVHTPQSQADIDRLYDAFAAGAARDGEALLAVARATLATRTNGGFHDANDVLEQAYDLPELTGEAGATWLEEELRLLHASIFIEKYAAEEARDLLAPIVARDPSHRAARTLLARAALTTGDVSMATQLAARILDEHPDASGAKLLLAWGLVVQGQDARADAMLAQISPRTLLQAATARALHATVEIRGRRRSTADALEDAVAGLDPTGWYLFPQLADLLAHTHLYRELQEVLEWALKRDPSNFYSRSAHALNLLRLGDDDGGLREIEQAWKGDKFNERTFNTRALFREVLAQDYELIRQGDVELRVPIDASPALRARMFDEIRVARETFERRYRVDLPEIRVEVYRTPREFAVRTIGVPALGALGVCFGPVVTLVGPFRGRFNFSRVLWHELAHSYALAASDRRVPRWFTEGLSEWEAGQRDGSWRATITEELAAIHHAGASVPLSQLEGAFVLAESHHAMGRAYLQATAAVEFLMTKLGDSGLREALTAFGSGQQTDEVLPRLLGISPRELDAQYQRWISNRVRGVTTGWVPPTGEDRAPDVRLDHWERANGALERGDLEACLQQLDLLDRADGIGYASLLLRGIVRRERGEFASAIETLRKAEEYTSARSEHLVLLARIARDAGDEPAEEDALRTVLRRDFSNAEAPARLVILTLAAGSSTPEPFLMERLQQIAPTSPRTLAIVALRLADQGARRPARELLDLALAADPTDADTLLLIALAARACDRSNDATTAAARASRKALSPASRRLLTTHWPASRR